MHWFKWTYFHERAPQRCCQGHGDANVEAADLCRSARWGPMAWKTAAANGSAARVNSYSGF